MLFVFNILVQVGFFIVFAIGGTLNNLNLEK